MEFENNLIYVALEDIVMNKSKYYNFSNNMKPYMGINGIDTLIAFCNQVEYSYNNNVEVDIEGIRNVVDVSRTNNRLKMILEKVIGIV